MQNWADIYDDEEAPTAVKIVQEYLTAFGRGDTNSVVIDHSKRDQLILKPHHYSDKGLVLPLGDWGDYVHPAELCANLHRRDIPTRYEEAIRDEFKRRGVEDRYPMSRAPGAKPVKNPHAARDISEVLAYEAVNFLRENGSKAYKVTPSKTSCALKFTASDKYASAKPTAEMLADVKKHLEKEFNVVLNDMDDKGVITFKVTNYKYVDEKEALLKAFNDPANAHLGEAPAYSLKGQAPIRAFDCFVMAQGRLTPIRHGYVAGCTISGAPRLREFRVQSEEGYASYLVPGSSIEGASSKAFHTLQNLKESAREGTLCEESIYRSALPDYFVEELVACLKRSHDAALSVSEVDTLRTSGATPESPETLKPVAAKDLKAGDKFGASSSDGEFDWLEVKKNNGVTINAWLINGEYAIDFDVATEASMPCYGMPAGGRHITYTAPVPFKQNASYPEAIAYMQKAYADSQTAVVEGLSM